jgi:deoxyadenosine/deoxycytidine kinase
LLENSKDSIKRFLLDRKRSFEIWELEKHVEYFYSLQGTFREVFMSNSSYKLHILDRTHLDFAKDQDFLDVIVPIL